MNVLIVSGDRSSPEGRPINLGDAYLTDSLVSAMATLGNDARAVDFGPGSHLRRDRVGVTGFRGLLSRISDADLVVLGGGTLVQDDIKRGLRGMPRLVAATSAAAHFTRTPMFGFGLGCEVVRRPAAKWLVQAGLAGRSVAVRDQASQRNLFALTRIRPRLAADTSLLGQGQNVSRDGSRSGTLVSLTWHEAALLDLRSFKALAAFGGPVRFVQMSQWGDFADARTLKDEVRPLFSHITKDLTVPSMWPLYSTAATVVASRMHALYAGLLSGCHLVAVGDIPKVRTFAKEFEVPWRQSVADLASDPPEPSSGSTLALEAARTRGWHELSDLVRAASSRR